MSGDNRPEAERDSRRDKRRESMLGRSGIAFGQKNPGNLRKKTHELLVLRIYEFRETGRGIDRNGIFAGSAGNGARPRETGFRENQIFSQTLRT
jgi:hypothetical protein